MKKLDHMVNEFLDAIGEPKETVLVQARLDKAVHKTMQQLCDKLDISQQDFLGAAVKAWCEALDGRMK